MLGGMAVERKRKRPPAQRARRNVVPIHKLPRHIERMPEAQLVAWVLAATQLTLYELLMRPRIVRKRLLAAVKRERRAARKRRTAI